MSLYQRVKTLWGLSSFTLEELIGNRADILKDRSQFEIWNGKGSVTNNVEIIKKEKDPIEEILKQ